MRKSLNLWMIAALVGGAASGDVLITQDGRRIETQGPWTITKVVVEFTNAEGIFSCIRLSEIDLEASEEATRQSAKAREEPHGDEVNEEPRTSPMTEVILRSRVKEKKKPIREITHDEVSGPALQQFRQQVAKVLAAFSDLRRRYDLDNPEAFQRVRIRFQAFAEALRELLLRPLPKRQKVLEEQREVEALAAYFEKLAMLATLDYLERPEGMMTEDLELAYRRLGELKLNTFIYEEPQ